MTPDHAGVEPDLSYRGVERKSSCAASKMHEVGCPQVFVDLLKMGSCVVGDAHGELRSRSVEQGRRSLPPERDGVATHLCDESSALCHLSRKVLPGQFEDLA